jgi:hypothetical protein
MDCNNAVNCSLAGRAGSQCVHGADGIVTALRRSVSFHLLCFLPQKRYRAVPNGVTITDQLAHELSAATRR